MDCSFKTNEGRFNFRVGAIIINENKILMVQHDGDDFYYSVGGRVKMNETTEEAIIRETLEETGKLFGIDRLGFVHENLFTYDRTGERFTELAFFYYMKPNEHINLIKGALSEYNESGDDLNLSEKLVWLSLDKLNNITIYPEFFKTKLLKSTNEIQHFIQRT